MRKSEKVKKDCSPISTFSLSENFYFIAGVSKTITLFFEVRQ